MKRVVIETNLVVSAALTPVGVAASVVKAALTHQLTLFCDQRILDEYVEVLSRAKFHLDLVAVAALLDELAQASEVVAAAPLGVGVPDEKDLAFIEVARTGGEDWLITGNARHFPTALLALVDVVSPAQAGARLRAAGVL